jgi:enoyl-CoA hydratase
MTDNQYSFASNEILYIDVGDRIATITLHRPEVRNALNGELLADLTAALAAVEESNDIDVTILTGADPAFCTGLDLSELSSKHGLNLSELAGRGAPFTGRTKPLIGAINGAAVTGGLELALACDFIIASERAVFADTHARMGLIPFWGLTVLLPRAIGIRNAREMSASGNFIDARRAHEMGLVNFVVPHDQLLESAHQLGVDISSNDQPAVRALMFGYSESESLFPQVARDREIQRAIEWQSSGSVEEQIDFRKEIVIERGRSQLASE